MLLERTELMYVNATGTDNGNQLIRDILLQTLHMKNLLHLGEDRYLTTLLLKNFPSYKLTFTKDAHARTM